MPIGHSYNVSIVSPSSHDHDIVDKLEIAKNVLNRWNKRYSQERKMFFFLDANSGLVSIQENNKLKEADLLIFLMNSVNCSDCVDKVKEIINVRKHNKKATLAYCNNLNLKILEQTSCCRECSEEEFEFNLTCDISAFVDFDRANIVEFETLNIKVNGRWDKAKVTYLASLIFYSHERPVKFKDRAIFSSGDIKLFEPREKIISKQKAQNKNGTPWTYVDCEFKADNEQDATISFTYEILVEQNLEKDREIKVTIPYKVQSMFVNIDTADVSCDVEAYLGDGKIAPLFKHNNHHDKNAIHNFEFSNIPANSVLNFKLNDEKHLESAKNGTTYKSKQER